ncbi:hypothetical protein KVR01_007630 [Diaporthe batatas]|uniref:uncharacterized protein n=1 Tax=Diaporthe batatas TaxID=748121 RepID=UPI001D058302|nr:uncharacterized protein KVR01_007630 [Diaporthe batatas]KAG8163152.1 hypothetical protein KVR01_007630 [Diaporthe batatas]
MAKFNKSTILYIAVFTGSALGAPPAATSIGTSHHTEPPTIKTGVFDSAAGPRPTEAVRASSSGARLQRRMVEPPDHLTIEITNSYGQDITTAHASNAGSPTPVDGPIPAGVIPDGSTASFAVPTGWAGNVALNRGGMPLNGDVTLLEAAFAVPDGWEFAVAGVDVSHVDGFTVPVTCECDGEWVTGCNKDLFDANAELEKRGTHSPAIAALNPLRDDMGATSATEFFEPCEGLAYTYPNDHSAFSFGACQSGTISCCVGVDR